MSKQAIDINVNDMEQLVDTVAAVEDNDVPPIGAFDYDIREEDEEVKNFLIGKSHEQYQSVAFASPIELFMTFNPPLAAGESVPHMWQIETSDLMAAEYTKDDPLRLILLTCNASGKDSYTIAPFSVWFIWTNIRSKCIITSASWQQLQSQTEPYIRTLCQAINDKLQRKVFIIKKMCILCVDTGSIIWLFTTDDPGRAEGHHPFSDYKHSKVAIIINEAKTVPDSIFQAFNRCTFSYWIEVSSPGNTRGHLYNSVSRSRMYPEKFERNMTSYYCRRVRSTDCPHISAAKREFDKVELGESSPTYRSQHLAEFTSLDENVIITLEAVNTCVAFAEEEYMVGTLTGGLDLAAGGDENAFYVFRNNVFVGKETFSMADTTAAKALFMEVFFPKYGFTKETAKNIYVDDGGLGRPIINDMHAAGWKVTRVNNQSRALRTDMYGNRGAELWCNVKRLVEEKILVLPKDDYKLISQLSSRYYAQHKTTGKLILESKREARAKGHGSPDRADALCLAFAGHVINNFINAKRQIVPAAPTPRTKLLTTSEASRLSTNNKQVWQQRLQQHVDQLNYGNTDNITKKQPAIRTRFKHPSQLLRNIYGGRN